MARYAVHLPIRQRRPGVPLTACGGRSTHGEKTIPPASLRFLAGSGPGEVPLFEPLLPQYIEERPHVKVELDVISEGGWNKVNALLVADAAPDVSRVNDDSVYYWGSQGKLLHPDPYVNRTMKRDAYFPPAWQAMAVDGKRYSLQPHLGVNLFVYNNEFTRDPAERFLRNEIKAREFPDQG